MSKKKIRSWQINELGDPWTHLSMADVTMPALPDGTCRISVEAVDLNFADILQCQGSYQVKPELPFTPGMNAIGTIVEVAEGVEYSVGDRIIGPAHQQFGGYADECFIAASKASAVQEGIDPIKAAAMHVTYGTAWFGLHLRGKLQPGETVLVLAGAGGVGSAAIELAKVHGCWVIAAAGSKDKTDACLSLGADEVVDYNNEDLYERVMTLTYRRGVDVVYDPVGGDYFDIARRLVAWEGRLLIIGFASGTIPSAQMNHALVKNYSIVGVHMGGYRGRSEAPFEQCYAELYQLLIDGKIDPLVDEVIGFNDLPNALKRLADRKTKGRVVFVPTR
jgi:NADPH2:quinone reductase